MPRRTVRIFHPALPDRIGSCMPEALPHWQDLGWQVAEVEETAAVAAVVEPEPHFVESYGHLVPDESEWTASATSDQEADEVADDADEESESLS